MAVKFDLLAWIINALMGVACLCGGLMMLHILLDVLCRNFLNQPIPGTIEVVSAYYMVAIAYFPLAHISRGEGHIAVELFTSGLSARGQRTLGVAVGLLTAVYLALLLWASSVAAIDKTLEGEVRETARGFMDVWPSRWFLALGFLAMLAETIRQLLLLSERRAGSDDAS